MYLDANLQGLIDRPTKDFEVAIRCYVADMLLTSYDNEEVLKNEIKKRLSANKDSHTILSGKISSLSCVRSEKEWTSFYSNLLFSLQCLERKKHIDDHDVEYTKSIILVTYLFQDKFSLLIDAFNKPEEYISYSYNFYELRNALSHRGSTRISDDDTTKCIYFIERSKSVLDSKYYWFSSSDTISQNIQVFSDVLYSKVIRIENFDCVPFPSNAIVCREPEIDSLFKYVCGWDGQKRLRNSKHLVCISGYGGIGKTSLVTEFLSRLLQKIQQDEYTGIRPFFILFYSAKMQSMEFDDCSGELYIQNYRAHFTDFNTLIKKFYADLNIARFDDDWNKPGILVVDNFETLSPLDRKSIIEYINYELPPSIHVIITTRIPEHADELIPLKGYQNEAGVEFINEFIRKNNLLVRITEEQKVELIRNSYGNSLVLVLALKRLALNKVSFREIIKELKSLPKDAGDSIISHFMFQNTINELFLQYPDCSETMKSVLICLSSFSDSLTSGVLARALKGSSIESIESVLQLLTKYLVTEKTGESYSINEFALRFVMTSLPVSQNTKAKIESDLLSAVHEIEVENKSVDDYKMLYPDLAKVLLDWCGKDENENLTICRAFSLYEEKRNIENGNTDYEIDQLNREFEHIENDLSAHPYVYYQRARILKELRQAHIVSDVYNDSIKRDYERCLMMIETPSFSDIKSTETYPSILWIFSMFLYDINSYEEASHYAYNAMKNFEKLRIMKNNYRDSKLVYAIAEVKLFRHNLDKKHLENAREIHNDFISQKRISDKTSFQMHLEQLDKELLQLQKFKV